jgi:hypothetical protein
MLTDQQVAKIARWWVWCGGQMALGHVEDSDGFLHYSMLRIVDVHDGCPFVWFGIEYRAAPLRGALPVLTDLATADGLLRTARSAWRDPYLSATITQSGQWWITTRRRTNESALFLWAWDGVSFARTGSPYSVRFVGFDSEADALIAAILAAPEEK